MYFVFRMTLMQLVRTSSVSFETCFGRAWPSSAVSHYGMSLLHVGTKTQSSSTLINFSVNQLNPVPLVSIVYSSKRPVCATFLRHACKEC
jgi:hypothetical protein